MQSYDFNDKKNKYFHRKICCLLCVFSCRKTTFRLKLLIINSMTVNHFSYEEMIYFSYEENMIIRHR